MMARFRRRMLLAVFTLLAGGVLSSLAGCGNENKNDTSNGSTQVGDQLPGENGENGENGKNGENGEKDKKEVTLVKLDLEEFKKEIDSHKGKIIIVDVWGFN